MKTDLIIRQGIQADLLAMEWEGEYSHFRRLFAESYRQVELGRALVWIAELPQVGLVGQLIVSLNSYRPELADGRTRAYLYGFRVKPAYRHQGIGRLMLRAVEASLRERGFSQLTLNVGKENLDGRKFYESLGYRVTGSDPGQWSYIDNYGQTIQVDEPAWRMLKELLSAD